MEGACSVYCSRRRLATASRQGLLCKDHSVFFFFSNITIDFICFTKASDHGTLYQVLFL